MTSILASGVRKYDHIRVFDEIYEARMDALSLQLSVVSLYDTVPSDALPYLAAELDVLGYKGYTLADTDAKKRELLNRAIELHQYIGTPYAIEEALRLLGYEATVIEYLVGVTYNGAVNYNGTINHNQPTPFHFSVDINYSALSGPVTPAEVVIINKIIAIYKNKRSWLYQLAFRMVIVDDIEVEDIGPAFGTPPPIITYNGLYSYNGVINY